jgi:hypothetical protein
MSNETCLKMFALNCYTIRRVLFGSRRQIQSVSACRQWDSLTSTVDCETKTSLNRRQIEAIPVTNQ